MSLSLLLLNPYIQAMQALDEKHLLGGSVTPLAVKWADPELQIKKRRAVEDSNTDNRMVRVRIDISIIWDVYISMYIWF